MEKISSFRERVSSVSHVEMPRRDIWKSLIAEFLGTALLLIVGVGSACYIKDVDKPTLTAIALAWGIMIATLAQTIGHISGCHINPAATIAFLVARKIELVKAILYIICQCVGATCGVLVLKALTPEGTKGDYGVIHVQDEFSLLQGCLIEFIITFILLLIVFAVSDEARTDVQGSPPLAIGLTVTALILATGNMTGAGLNPARVLGPAIVENKWKHHWVYWVGCIGGGVVAGLVYEYVLRMPSQEELQEKRNRRNETTEMKDGTTSPPV